MQSIETSQVYRVVNLSRHRAWRGRIVGDALSDLRSDLLQCEERGGLEALAFRALSVLKQHNMIACCPMEVVKSGFHRSVRQAHYTYLASKARSLVLVKLILHLNSYTSELCGATIDGLIGLTDRTPERVLCICLRRSLDLLTEGKTFRFGSGLTKTDGDKPCPPEGFEENALHARLLDANNRFSVLFREWECDTDPTFYPYSGVCKDQDDVDVTNVPLDEKRYWTAAKNNQLRESMNLPLKGDASVRTEKFAKVDKKCRTSEALKKFYQIVSDLSEWRRDILPEFLKDKDPEVLTIKPAQLLEAYERWFKEQLDNELFIPPKLGIPSFNWDVPRVWDTDPRVVGLQIPRLKLCRGEGHKPFATDAKHL